MGKPPRATVGRCKERSSARGPRAACPDRDQIDLRGGVWAMAGWPFLATSDLGWNCRNTRRPLLRVVRSRGVLSLGTGYEKPSLWKIRNRFSRRPRRLHPARLYVPALGWSGRRRYRRRRRGRGSAVWASGLGRNNERFGHVKFILCVQQFLFVGGKQNQSAG